MNFSNIYNQRGQGNYQSQRDPRSHGQYESGCGQTPDRGNVHNQRGQGNYQPQRSQQSYREQGGGCGQTQGVRNDHDQNKRGQKHNGEHGGSCGQTLDRGNTHNQRGQSYGEHEGGCGQTQGGRHDHDQNQRGQGDYQPLRDQQIHVGGSGQTQEGVPGEYLNKEGISLSVIMAKIMIAVNVAFIIKIRDIMEFHLIKTQKEMRDTLVARIQDTMNLNLDVILQVSSIQVKTQVSTHFNLLVKDFKVDLNLGAIYRRTESLTAPAADLAAS